MFKTILVAVDDSTPSNLGLEEAVLLASEQKSTLCVLHVVEEFVPVQGPETPVCVEEPWQALRDTGRKVLAHAAGKAERRGVTTRAILAETIGRSVGDVILEQAKKCGADLIVLGTHGRRGMSRLVMGSDAEDVVREATVPVLLVRSRRSAPKAPEEGAAGA